MLHASSQKRFITMASATVITIYALILVGGIVRATGAGMGCPDWPTCFGQWIPPTAEAQLPADYQQIYADRGYADTTFNLRKTWTEYLNRLLGVFTGFTIFLTLLFSLPYRRSNPMVFWLSLAGFILVGVQGWLGSRVVASNLNPGMITLHMLLAQVIVGLLIWSLLRASVNRHTHADVQALPQSDYINRHLWIDNLPLVFSVHKWLALPLVLFNAWLIVDLLGRTSSGLLRRLVLGLAFLLAATVVLGMSMDRLNLPIFAQPLHLWFASLIFGVQWAMLLVLYQVRQPMNESATFVATPARTTIQS